MAQTRIRLGPQLQQSSTPSSLIYTNSSNEATYLAPATGQDVLLFYDDSANSLAWATLGSGLTMTGTVLSSSGGSGGYSTVEEEGTPLTQRSTLNFVGAGFTASDSGSKTLISLNSTLNALSQYNTNGILTQTSADTFTGRTLQGTSGRITVSNANGVAGDPTINISTSYSGQSTITNVGILTIGTWQASIIGQAYGGTGFSTYTIGDILAASATNTLSKLAGNTTTTRKYLSQTGNGSISAMPSWQQIAETDIADGALLARIADNETITGTWTFSNNISIPTSQTNPTDAASKANVDALAFGLVKHYADLYTESNVTLSGEQTIDGVLTSASRVLLNGQTAAEENGVWVTAAGAWSRPSNLNTVSEINESLVVIVSGTTYANTFWTTIEDIATLGTDPISWVELNNPVTLVAGNGLTKTGDTLDVVTASSSRIVVNANNIDLASGVVGGSGAGTYGSASAIPSLTVDTYGRVTSTTSNAVSIASSAITDFTEAVQDVVGAFSVAGDGISLDYNDTTNQFTITANNIYNSDGTITASEVRTVTLGDASSELLIQNSTTGLLLQATDNSVVLMDGIGGFYENSLAFATAAGVLSMDASEFRYRMDSGLAIIQDTRVTTLGLQYAADYSADFTDRSLVDKQYVDDSIAGAAANAVEAFIENSTATTIDLDANVGNVKDVDGNNIAFTLPTNLSAFFVYRNGILLARTGSLTTRDYSVNTGTNAITFAVPLSASEIVLLKKF